MGGIVEPMTGNPIDQTKFIGDLVSRGVITQPPTGFKAPTGVATMAFEDFYNPTTGDTWAANTGGWTPAEGWVRGRKPADWTAPTVNQPVSGVVSTNNNLTQGGLIKDVDKLGNVTYRPPPDPSTIRIANPVLRQDNQPVASQPINTGQRGGIFDPNTRPYVNSPQPINASWRLQQPAVGYQARYNPSYYSNPFRSMGSLTGMFSNPYSSPFLSAGYRSPFMGYNPYSYNRYSPYMYNPYSFGGLFSSLYR